MSFDAIVVGGGLAGSTFAGALAERGHAVLVLEKDRQFRDRVRGENMLPWGVAVARRLGIVDDLLEAGAHQPRWWNVYTPGAPTDTRNLQATTPGNDVSLNMYHPDLQEALLERAQAAGATVRRGVSVVGLDPAREGGPTVTFTDDGVQRVETARIVVGADGRVSQMRAWGGFQVQRDPEFLTIAGLLIQRTAIPDDAVHLVFGPGLATLLAPLGKDRARAYFIYPGVAGRKNLSGPGKIREFFELCIAAGANPSWFEGAEPAGPLAEFDGADQWVQSPAANGIALIGDAAAASNPSWGSGLALTVTDVEHLVNALDAHRDWNDALAQYAREHDEYYSGLHRIHSWMTELLWTAGPEADARRGRVFPRMAMDPTGFPDLVGLGPFGPCDEQARRKMLGIEEAPA